MPLSVFYSYSILFLISMLYVLHVYIDVIAISNTNNYCSSVEL